MNRGEHLLETLGLVGRRGLLGERAKLLEGRAQVELESFEARDEVALDQVETTADDEGLLMLLVVEIDVAHAEHQH